MPQEGVQILLLVNREPLKVLKSILSLDFLPPNEVQQASVLTQTLCFELGEDI